MTDLREWIKKIEEQEERRVGDIYAECEKRGCRRSFLKAFDTRTWLFPETQARAFMAGRKRASTDQESLIRQMRQYRIFLEVLIEKRPNHEKRSEWERALRMIDTDSAVGSQV